MNPKNAPQEHSVHPAELAAECKRLVHRYADRRIDAFRGYDGLSIATVEAECFAAIDRLAALVVSPVHPAETALERQSLLDAIAVVRTHYRDDPRMAPLYAIAEQGMGHPAGSPSREHAAEAGSVEFEVWQGDEMYASSFGPRDQALSEAMHYASQCACDGSSARVLEVTRTLIAQVGPELCSHASQEAARQDVKEDPFGEPGIDDGGPYNGLAPQAVPLPVPQKLWAVLRATLQGIADANWRKWDELSSPEQFELWAKNRARWAVERIDEVVLASAPQAPAPEPIQTQDSGHQAERLIPDAHRDGEASS